MMNTGSDSAEAFTINSTLPIASELSITGRPPTRSSNQPATAAPSPTIRKLSVNAKDSQPIDQPVSSWTGPINTPKE